MLFPRLRKNLQTQFQLLRFALLISYVCVIRNIVSSKAAFKYMICISYCLGNFKVCKYVLMRYLCWHQAVYWWLEFVSVCLGVICVIAPEHLLHSGNLLHHSALQTFRCVLGAQPFTAPSCCLACGRIDSAHISGCCCCSDDALRQGLGANVWVNKTCCPANGAHITQERWQSDKQRPRRADSLFTWAQNICGSFGLCSWINKKTFTTHCCAFCLQWWLAYLVWVLAAEG